MDEGEEEEEEEEEEDPLLAPLLAPPLALLPDRRPNPGGRLDRTSQEGSRSGSRPWDSRNRVGNWPGPRPEVDAREMEDLGPHRR